ncbi:hypothetical protein EGW08_021881 [Elysia chlorotica]|uniref:G-protein coupled receptors family 1 profile domain-containing protein n=1 Tax=Elysia chlorotica TaxID=188477 RepID=A0A3S1H1J9_ELYCH|nr:hypothetical protein EGW08_021881 [Elysia chlorotica]
MEPLIPKEVSMLLHSLAVLLPLLSNVSMLIIVCRVPMLHTPSFVLLSSLAAVDVVLALVWNFPFEHIDSTQTLYSRLIHPGSGACTVIGIVWQTAVSMSALLQATIACDRYLFIVHPFKYQRFITPTRAAGCCAVIFAVSVSLPVFIFISDASYQLEAPTKTCIQSNVWPILFLTLVLLPAASVVAFSSQRIWVLYSRMLQQIDLMQECTPTPTACLEELSGRSQCCGQIVSNKASCLDAHVGERLAQALQEDRRTTLKNVIQSVIMRNRALNRWKLKRRVHPCSKTDLNPAAPTVMITVCEKGGDGLPRATSGLPVPHIERALKDSDWHSGQGLTPVDTPIYTISSPSPFGARSAEGAKSPWSTCSSLGPMSRSTSDAGKSPRYLSPYPPQSRRNSIISDDFSRSRPSSACSESEGSMFHRLSLSSGPVGCSYSSSDTFPLSSAIRSSCPVSSLHGRHSTHSPLGDPEDILTRGSNTISALLNALMVKPEMFHARSSCTRESSSLSFGPNTKKRKITVAALRWASVGNPVISWMMALQSDREDASTLPTNRPTTPITDHAFSENCPILIHDPNGAVSATEPSFWVRARESIAAKCSQAKALLLLWGPLLLIVVSFLPLSIALTIWESGVRGHLAAQCVYIVCCLTYMIVPSLASMLLCLSNKPYRRVLLKYVCCLKKKKDRHTF